MADVVDLRDVELARYKEALARSLAQNVRLADENVELRRLLNFTL